MKLLLLVMAFMQFSCVTPNDNSVIEESSKKNNSFNHPDNFTTPNGQTIKFIVKDDKYYIQWHQEGSLKILNYAFDTVEGGNSSFPRLIAENKSYILLRAGCGNPCWFGVFLPLKNYIQPQIINEYIAYDLEANLVASIIESDTIEITNIKTLKKQYILIDRCESVFPGYCIDTAFFTRDSFNFIWTPKTIINSTSKQLKTVLLLQ